MPNDYDKILRENLDTLLPFIARKLLGLDLSRTETLKDKIQVTLEREGDLLHDDSEQPDENSRTRKSFTAVPAPVACTVQTP